LRVVGIRSIVFSSGRTSPGKRTPAMKTSKTAPVAYTAKTKRHNPELRDFKGISYRAGVRIEVLRERDRAKDERRALRED